MVCSASYLFESRNEGVITFVFQNLKFTPGATLACLVYFPIKLILTLASIALPVPTGVVVSTSTSCYHMCVCVCSQLTCASLVPSAPHQASSPPSSQREVPLGGLLVRSCSTCLTFISWRERLPSLAPLH